MDEVMPELRKDPVVGRWVIIATERARRPGNVIDAQRNSFDHDGECPFCNNQDPEILVLEDKASPKWSVRVVPSGTPILKSNGGLNRRAHGLYGVVNDYGAHEVVIETPEHVANIADLDVNQIRRVLEAYVIRFNALQKDPNHQYVIAYKNYGWSAGSRKIGHSRSQIIAAPVNPLSIKEKLSGARKYFLYHERCLYCDLIQQELNDKRRVVSETKHFIAITPFAPRFSFEVWIIPKRHHCDFAQGVLGVEDDLAGLLKETLLRLKKGLEDPAYNYVIQTAPLRRETDKNRWRTLQEDYHWHIEVMPRITRVAGFEKGSGFYICSIPPEHTAEYLREVEI
jgi:UDPglucose--hexose-1-phosphate uridylyltransferase